MSPNFQVTSPISNAGYYELEFHMGQNFWGCQFNFGNAACGTQIRQAFAHGMDKKTFVTTELSGQGVAIDNPVPPSVTLNSPNPCSWDAQFPQTGPNCIVNGQGGTAYHLAMATSGGGCTSNPIFPYTPGCGTPDFCAAADHIIAAGLATGKNPTTCVLTGISSAVTSNPIHIAIRSDQTRLKAGNSYAQFICGVFTGSFSTGCGVAPSTNNILIADPAPITAIFPPCLGTGVCLNWWVYTAGFGNQLTFDTSLFFGYDSRFVNGVASIKQPSGFCSSLAVPTFSPGDFMYLCSPSYDNKIEQAEFSPCLTAPGDPGFGGPVPTPTFASCPGTTQLSAASAAYQAQDIFGQNAFTIPGWTGTNSFGYLAGWQRGIVHHGDSFTPPGNFFTMLNAWNPTPQVPGTVRQGFAQSTNSVNPFIGNTNWDLGVQADVYDTLGIGNPANPQSPLDWMTIRTDQLTGSSSFFYTPPSGTVGALRFTLRSDIFWHTGQKVTAWDVAFSYIAFRANGVSVGMLGGLAPMSGVKVLSPTQFDIDLNQTGPFTRLSLSSIPIIPARLWSTCSPSTWDAGANNMNFANANAALTPCIAPSTSVTSSGVILPTASSVDNAKIQPSFDPVRTGIFVGSGPWVCGTGSGIGGPSCSSSGTQSVPAGGSWTFKRFGYGTSPGGSLNTYFRSSGNTALWIWSGNTGDFSRDFLNFGVAALCFGKNPPPLSCGPLPLGIGNPTGSTISPAPVGLTQVSIVQRFVGVNWVSPYDWRTNPPQGIATFPPVLHEGSSNLAPGNCGVPFNQGGGYVC
jgi:ABC-type transport system substrate-binding protein